MNPITAIERIFPALAAALCLLVFTARAARAHPHVWIENSVRFQFDDKKRLVKIIHRWKFDRMFSAAAAKNYKAGKDGTFTAKQAAKMRELSFGSIDEMGDFTHIYVNGELQFASPLEDFKPVMLDGALVCTFSVSLKVPLDPFKDKVEVAVYDGMYYYDITFDEPPVELAGISADACPCSIYEDAEHAEYFGLINPATVKLCRE